MSDLLVVGGGAAGLSTALFAARRGHRVTVVEPDPPPEGASADDDFAGWSRRGVAQARQGHIFLARSTEVLRQEAPDVLRRILARGALEVPLDLGDDAANVLSRRLVYEAVLRRAVAAEPRVSMVVGQRVRQLLAEAGGPVRRVVGARVGDDELRADLVVDATGRRSQAPSWLRQLGAPAPGEAVQPCGFSYVTRHYRLRPGAVFPTTQVPIVSPLDYITVLAFPGDNRSFQLSITVSSSDPLRARLLDPGLFDRLMAELPVGQSWIALGEPTSAPLAMAKIENRKRTLLADGQPVVTGLALVGDASIQTNPTTGRGVSFALSQAQALARLSERYDVASAAFLVELERWTAQKLGVWFDSQVAIDAVRTSQLDAGVRGERLPPATDPTNRLIAALAVLGREDAVVHAAARRLYNLLITPEELMGDRAVTRRILTFLRAHPVIDIRPPGLERAAFERLVVHSQART